MATNQITVMDQEHALAKRDFTREQVDLIKQTVARGCTDLEMQLFLYTARKRGLDPLLKQMYAIKRKTKNGEQMTMQTGIDGFRSIAGRTGQLAGIDDAICPEADGGKYPLKATVTVWRMVAGTRCPFTATARWDEYKQVNYNGELVGLWAKMPFTMLAKCAEALALRKAFPEDLSGLYSFEEMAQADSQTIDAVSVTPQSLPEGTVDAAPVSCMDDLKDYLEGLAEAPDIQTVNRRYMVAYKRALALKDKQAMEAIEAAADKRKADLEASK